MKQALLAWIREKLGITALELALKQEQRRISKIDLHYGESSIRLRESLDRLERHVAELETAPDQELTIDPSKFIVKYPTRSSD